MDWSFCTRWWAGALLVLSCRPALADDITPRHTLAAGYFISRGDYDQAEPTVMMAVPVSYKVSYGYWNLRLATSLLRIEGPGNIDLGAVTAGGAVRSEAETGIGDVFASVSRIVPAAGVWWEPYLKAKLPTGDYDQGLGTGETDAELGAELSRRVGRVSSAFAKLYYRWRGDPPGVDLANGLGAGVGLMHAPRPLWSGGVMLDYRFGVTANADPAQEITLFGTWKLDGQRSATVYLLGGISDASPDIGGGVQFQLIHD